MSRPKRKVVIVSGGPSSEHEVSLRSGELVAREIDRGCFEVVEIMITKEGEWIIPDEDGGRVHQTQSTGEAVHVLKTRVRPDIVFIAMHGVFGEDGVLQAVLEAEGIPYTGSRVASSACAMDKVMAAGVLRDAGLRVPRAVVLKREDVVHGVIPHISGAAILKPICGGSSIGVQVWREDAGVEALKEMLVDTMIKDPTSRMMLQEMVQGIEVTCGVIATGQGLRALPPTEIVAQGLFDYEAKYSQGRAQEITPARVADEMTQKIQETALRAHNALGCRGMSRTDMIISPDGEIWVLELNTIPGLTAQSLLPQQARAVGMTMKELITNIINASR